MDLFRPILDIVWKNTEKADNKRLKSLELKARKDINIISDIPYIDDGARCHLFDIYYPENNNNKLPFIIDVHGGGWMYGYKEINKNYCLELASKGFVVANINYSLAGKNGCQIINQIQDIFGFLGFISKKENYSKYPIDMDNVFLSGDSAGGQFACLTSAINVSKKLRNIFDVKPTGIHFKAVGAISPVIDILSFNPALNVNKKVLLGDNPKESPYYKFMDFSYIASNKLPPFYIVTSSGDFVQYQSKKLHKLLDSCGVENKLRNWEFRYDGKKLNHVFAVLDPFFEPGKFIVNEMSEFFKSHM